ncbi:response regulator [Arenibaculum pallidiluteum]|uniref:response regulator n=1 Tax=Arenibaculum pallidiluteum TaxID=2812559 RepID=UPI001A96E401|nr:response regulator [Arenibaculum pallidiluteum]
MRVMIVEDEYVVAWDMEALLSELGHTVVAVAAHGEEAVGLALDLRPDAIIMDIRLAQGTDGIDAARRIQDATGIRILFASALGDPETRRRAASVCPAGFLHKPVSAGAMARALEALGG